MNTPYFCLLSFWNSGFQIDACTVQSHHTLRSLAVSTFSVHLHKVGLGCRHSYGARELMYVVTKGNLEEPDGFSFKDKMNDYDKIKQQNRMNDLLVVNVF